MKGFKDKSGKFRPTGKRNKSPLTISQLRDKAKLEMKNGFKVYPNTVVNIADEEELPPAIVERVQHLFNEDPHFKKLRKHVDAIEMIAKPEAEWQGEWNNEEKRFTLNEMYDENYAEIASAHEIVGHVFWDWARAWRREEVVEFNELANSMPPINPYVENNEEDWRNFNDDNERLRQLKVDYDYIYDNFYEEGFHDEQTLNEMDRMINEGEEIQDDEGHQTMTRYANEMHSAMTELIYGVGGNEPTILLNDEQLEELTNAWWKLHY